ncbi:hypothetical protein ACFV29_43320 [Streptomyces sp. NPDC059690]|uniref:hypothetical protein n=1 Tax=Streptomyces sp. NPDC059690 TaxID=3346907 RepID=UPI0036A4661A
MLSRYGADAGPAAHEMSALDDHQIITGLVRQSHRAGRLPDRIESTAVRRTVEVARANGTTAGQPPRRGAPAARR